MSVLDLLHELASRKVRIWLDGKQLRFKAPKGAMTSALRKQLKAQKAAVIAHLSKDLAVKEADEGIPAADRSENLPLSYAQQRLWFIDQMDPGNPTYNISFADDLKGQLDPVALEQAFGDLVARHESLRTTFPNMQGKPVQLIAEQLEVAVAFYDFSTMELATQRQSLVDLVSAIATKPFSLGDGPLFRLALARLSPEHHVLTVVLHHIIADGWSLDVFLSEWGALYKDRLAQRVASLEPLKIQYADFAVWQRAWLDDGAMKKQTAFWKKQLAEPRSDSQLPTDYPRPKKFTHEGALHFFSIDSDIFKSLRRYREGDGATPFMTFLSAFMVLLYRLSDQKDLLIGTPVAQRDRAELEQMIGFLVNTVVIRGDLHDKPSFDAFHRQIQTTTLSSFAHADVPFEKLVEVLQPERDPSRNPLMQVMFSMHNSERKAFELPGLSLTPFKYEAAVAHFDLTLGLEIHGDQLLGFFEYSTDLFQAAFIERMAVAFETLLGHIAADPTRGVDEYELLNEANREALNAGWRSLPSADAPGLLERLAGVVEDQSACVAINSPTASLTYSDLDEQSDRLALALQSKGIASGSKVLFLADPSPWMPVCLVALAKLGVIGIPVQGSWPGKTKTAILEAEKPALCLALESPKQSDGSWLQVADLLAIEPEGSLEKGSPSGYRCHDPDAFGDSLVHVLDEAMVLDTCEAWLAQASPQAKAWMSLQEGSTFASLSYVWACILGGKELVIPQSKDSLDAQIAWASEANVKQLLCNHMQAVLLHHQITIDTNPFQQVFIVGDGTSLAVSQESDVSSLAPYQWVHALGSGELLGFSQLHRKAAVPHNRFVLERAQSKAWTVKNALGKSVNQAVPGEIYLLAGEQPTGERGRILSGGSPELLGRVDRKIRYGTFVLDLDLLEAQLVAHGDLEKAHVALLKNQAGESFLAAWYSVLGLAEPSHDSLMAFLEPLVVDACIPTLWMEVEAWPMDKGGRVLTQELPAMDLGEESEELAEEDPATPQEWMMAVIWAEVLGVKQIRRNDHFFKMGGHSLMAVLVLARITDIFEESLPIRALFENPTLSGFTAQLKSVKAA